jgi:polyisoprenyl-teichoic acid--peptidoglycan teichoic acid transferase
MRSRLRTLVATAALVAVAFSSAALATDELLLPAPADDGVLTLLLLGSDEGPNRSPNPLVGRADGFQLLFVSGDRQHATFVSIPRDSYIPVAGRGTTRINACLVSGPENCVTTVEREFGIEVDHYLLTSMRGFANAVKAFGGLTVDVPTPVFDGGEPIRSAGVQHLEGLQALTYARDRKNRPGGDFGRSQAQAELLAIGHADVVGAGSVGAVLDAVTVLRRHSVTDLSGPQLVRFGFEAMQLPPANVQRALAPARLGMAGPAAVAFLQPAAYDLIRDAADDARITPSGGG